MKFEIFIFCIFVAFASLSDALSVQRIDPTTPKPTTPRTTTLKTTTVAPQIPGKEPVANGPIVVFIHHGTLDGPSGRFQRTEFAASPPVDLSLPPVPLPEFIPVHEEPQEFEAASSDLRPRFERTRNLAFPPSDLSQAPILLPEAVPIYEPPQEVNTPGKALIFIRG